MRALATSFARNTVFANIVLLFIFFGGYLAIRNMSRETFPDIELDMVRITVPWPGADPEEVEEGISRRIEEAIDGLEGIHEYLTISNEHVALAVIEVMDGYDVRRVKEEVRNAVDAIATFPLDAERPIVEEFVLRMQVMLLSLTGPDLSDVELREYAEIIKDEIRDLPEVTQASVVSARPYEIAIEVSEERLRQYGITFEQVAQVVRANSMNVPGGTMRTEGEQIRLRTVGRNYTGADFEDIVVLAQPSGQHITLGRIANIRDGLTEENTYMRFNGEKAINIQVRKTRREDTLVIDRAVMEYVERKQSSLPEGVALTPWRRRAIRLEARIDLLMRNGLIGLMLVFMFLWLFLDIRLSFWAGMGMPVSIMGAFIVMWYYDVTINMMTLFGMITVLGIIVDDAIVVGEAIYVARKNGMPPLQAAVEGTLEVGLPVIAAVTTSIIAFMPLFFVAGTLGRMIVVLPLVVVAALAVSLVECLILLPAHLNHLPDPNVHRASDNILRRLGKWFHSNMNLGLERFVTRYYSPVIGWALRWRYISLSIAIMVLLSTWGLVDSGIVKFETFPRMDGDNMSAVIEFPSGTPLDVTAVAVTRLEEALYELAAETQTGSGAPLVENTFSIVGSRFDERCATEIGSNFGSVRVDLLSMEERDIHVETIMAGWEQKIGMITGALALTVQGGESGPTAQPIEIWLQGDDLHSLIAASEDLQEILAGFAGVYQIQDDYRVGPNEIKLRLKPEARALGLHVADLAQQIFTGYYGTEVVRVQRGKDDVRVRVRYPKEEREMLDMFENIRIRPRVPPMGGRGRIPADNAAPRTVEVPLLSVADISYTSGATSIRRTNGQRRLVVSADVQTEIANAREIIDYLNEMHFPELQARHRDVTMEFKGDHQAFRDAIDSLYIGFPMAIIGIFIIIATVFRSYVQPLVILVTVPFGMSGAVFGHLLMGHDLTMMSVFGLVALAGVVVNDAIVLIERINNYLADGMPFYEAVQRGGERRFRAIFLTTITTVGGLAPLIMETDRAARPLIPMAISLAAGITFATLLTLLLVPSLICILNDLRRWSHFLFSGVMPTPEEVEPARLRRLDPDA